MRKKYVNYTVALVLAFISIVGARCLRIYIDTHIVTAAPDQNPPQSIETTVTQEYRLEPTKIIIPTETLSTPNQIIETLTPVSIPEIISSEEFSAEVNPLTGLKVVDPSILERRPMVIKITNFPRGVRPQWGLNLADHVYEYYIGDDLTRFIGVFYGRNAERVGPVRSARMFDEHIMRMYNGIFVFAYADDRVLDELMTTELSPYLVIETKHNCPPLCRFEHHGMAYNNLFADTATLGGYVMKQGGDNQRQNLNGLFFSSYPPPEGEPGEQVFITFTYASYHFWEYDQQRCKYFRFQEMKNNTDQSEPEYLPLLDTLDLEQVSADNLVILHVPHDVVYQSSSTTITDMPLKGDGKGFALRDGQIYAINWITNGKNNLFSLYFPDGKPYPLKPGNIWFEIIGKTSIIEQGENGRWDITFRMP